MVMYRVKAEKCLTAIRKFSDERSDRADYLDEPSDKIERPNLAVRLGRSPMPLRLSENFLFCMKKGRLVHRCSSPSQCSRPSRHISL
jgi:hypothetical protein